MINTEGYDTNSCEWKLVCLARSLLAEPLTQRREALERMGKLHSPKAMETLKRYIVQEFKRQREAERAG